MKKKKKNGTEQEKKNHGLDEMKATLLSLCVCVCVLHDR